MNETPALKIENLRTYFFSKSKQAFVRSVDNVTYEIRKGETLGVVGESGSGKSVTALSVMGLIKGEPGVISGKIDFTADGVQKNLLQGIENHVTLSEKNGMIMEVSKDGRGWRKNAEQVMRRIRGREISMIFQNPKSALNPFVPVGKQITESILLNTSITDRREAEDKTIYWLEQVKIDSPALRYDNYPYGLSGGMCQRVMIAMALASDPSLLIADEPTTGLDATIQSRIVDLMGELKSGFGITTMLISHDINVITRLSDSIVVMYGGTVMEYGPADILSAVSEARHPYTSALLASLPGEEHIRGEKPLPSIHGDVLDTVNIPAGCRFFPRCTRPNDTIRERCEHREPDLVEISPGHKIRCWLHSD